MADLGELAAVLAASGNNSSQARTLVNAINPQPNSMETGLALEATRNPFAMPYYQAARLERTGNRMSPEAMQALQAAQARDHQLEVLKAIASPLATITGNSQAAIPGAMQVLGAPLDNDLFALEQLLATRSANADAVQSVGSGVQSAASGGGDFNDVLTQLGFDPLDRVTPTSVQSAAAGRKPDDPVGPQITDVGYANAANRTVKYPPNYIPTLEEAAANLGRETLGFGDASVTGSDTLDDDGADNVPLPTVPGEVMARINAISARNGYSARGEVKFVGYDARGEPMFGQQVTRGGLDDVIISSRNDAGQWVTQAKSVLDAARQP